jgi:phosphoserine phosphatase
MRLILVRHGETLANKQGIILGYKDEGLNETGMKQAQAVANRLSKEKIDIAYASDLGRAQETASYILKSHPDLTLITTSLLREKHAGEMEGKEKSRNQSNKNVFHSYKPNGGESFSEAQERVVQFYREIMDKHLGKTVLLVSHGALLGTLFVHLMGLDLVWENYDKYRPQNCSVSIIELDNQKVHNLKLHDCVKHLESTTHRSKLRGMGL